MVQDSDLFNLRGKTAIVTGGGSGIGRRVALALARYGVRLLIADIDEEAAGKVVSEIKAEGGEADALRVDVTAEQDVKRMVSYALEKYGRIDILFNNAGIILTGPAESLPLEAWNKTIAVNLTGMFLCAQAVGRVMIKQGGGKIISTSSVSGKLGHPGNVAYAASKHGVIGMTKVMAVEWGKYHVNVNCIGPGIARTPMTERLFKNEEWYRQQVAKVPMGRLAETDDLVGAVIFLASPASDYITGQTIFIEGGRTAD
ncbi:MAG: 3-oxoacyl-ACP reductase FabG [Candidatus Bathyarchaeia archaeon]